MPADLPVGDVRRGPTCFACEHSIGASLDQGWHKIHAEGFAHGPLLYPIVIRPICLKHRVAFCTPCGDFEPVRDHVPA